MKHVTKIMIVGWIRLMITSLKTEVSALKTETLK
jgi:hypothetical protein